MNNESYDWYDSDDYSSECTNIYYNENCNCEDCFKIKMKYNEYKYESRNTI